MTTSIYDIRIKTLTPMFIGNGEVWDPSSYVVNNNKFLKIPTNIIAEICNNDSSILKDLEKIESNTKSNNLLISLHNKIKTVLNLPNFVNIKKELPYSDLSPYMLEKFQSMINDREFMKYEIFKHVYSINNNETRKNNYSFEPYIPGSSLKGCIVTAMLNNYSKKFFSEGKFNNEEYKNIGSQFIVSDAFSENKLNSKIEVVRRFYKYKTDDTGMTNYLETIPANSIFKCQLKIKDNSVSNVNNNCIKYFLELIEDQGKFYRDIFESIYKNNDSINTRLNKEFINNVEEALKNKNNILICVGGHSGAETKTLSDRRYIKIIKGKKASSREPETTTVWMSSASNDEKCCLPLGWCILTVNKSFN